MKIRSTIMFVAILVGLVFTGVSIPTRAVEASCTPTVTVAPHVILPGNTATVSWTGNCGVLSIAGLTSSTAASGSITTPVLTMSTTYVLGGTASGTISVIVAPYCTIDLFTATPTTISYGGTSSIAWKTNGPTGCTSLKITPSLPMTSYDWSSTGQVTNPLTSTTTFTISATSTRWGTSKDPSPKTVTVTVLPASPPPPPPPVSPCTILSFTATPLSVGSGGTSLLAWNTKNCTSVTITGGSFSGVFGPSSSGMTTGPLSTTTTFRLIAK